MRNAALFLISAAVAFSQAPQVPRPSPPFTIERIDNSPLQLSQYKGKVVVLAFIFTTCPHCQAFTKELNAMEPDYAPKGVQFLECAFDPAAQAGLPEFIRLYQPAFPIGFAGRSAVESYLLHSVLGPPLYVPHLVILDRHGVIQGDYPGEGPFMSTDREKHIREQLDLLLKAAPATTAEHKAKK